MAASAVLETRERVKRHTSSSPIASRDPIRLDQSQFPPRELLEIEQLAPPAATIASTSVINLPVAIPLDQPHPFIERLKGVPHEIMSGLKLAAKILVPTWLLLWMGGAAADQISVAAGLAPQSPVTRPLSSTMRQAVQINTTQTVTSGMAIVNQSPEQLWSSLEPTRELLKSYSPDMSAWFEGLHESGKLSISTEDFSLSHSRYSDARKWSGELILYPGFFNLTDGEKVVVLRHERSHFEEGMGGYISNSIRPQVLLGATVRFFGGVGDSLATRFGFQSPGWGSGETIFAKWQYDLNRSEREACRNEYKTAADLGVDTAEEPVIRADLMADSPLQEIAGVGLVALLFLRRRKQRAETAGVALKVVSSEPAHAASRAA